MSNISYNRAVHIWHGHVGPGHDLMKDLNSLNDCAALIMHCGIQGCLVHSIVLCYKHHELTEACSLSMPRILQCLQTSNLSLQLADIFWENEIKYIFIFSSINLHWGGTWCWILSSLKTRTHLSHLVTTIAAEGLLMQESRPSATNAVVCFDGNFQLWGLHNDLMVK